MVECYHWAVSPSRVPPSSGLVVDLIGHRENVILKEPRRLKNLPFNLGVPNNVRSQATSTGDSSHSLDAPLWMTIRPALNRQSPVYLESVPVHRASRLGFRRISLEPPS
jgi:hypothetical protein